MPYDMFVKRRSLSEIFVTSIARQCSQSTALQYLWQRFHCCGADPLPILLAIHKLLEEPSYTLECFRKKNIGKPRENWHFVWFLSWHCKTVVLNNVPQMPQLFKIHVSCDFKVQNALVCPKKVSNELKQPVYSNITIIFYDILQNHMKNHMQKYLSEWSNPLDLTFGIFFGLEWTI